MSWRRSAHSTACRARAPSTSANGSNLAAAEAVAQRRVLVDVAAVGVRALVVRTAGNVVDPAPGLALDRMRRRARAVLVRFGPRRENRTRHGRERKRCVLPLDAGSCLRGP